jgi:hypothetical protein
MGTTLTGLTPATTYDALIKVGDNGPLSATAKYVGDGLGNDSVVALSTSSVGIGTTSPTQLLHVAGNVRITGALYDGNNAAGTSGQILSSTGTATDWVSKSDLGLVDGSGTANFVSKWSDTDTLTNSLIFDNGTNVGIGNTSPVAKLDVTGTLAVSGNAAFDTNVLFVDATNNRVGINTSTPSSNLSVVGSLGVSGASTFSSITTVNIGATAGNTFVVDKVGGANVAFQASGVYSGQIDCTATGDLQLSSASTYRVVVITSAGNVGIGTTSPASKLDVNGDIATSGDIILSGAKGIYFDNAASKYLDDYEEGTWTPTISFGRASVGVTYGAGRAGQYTKVGRQVTLTAFIVLTSKGSSTGGVHIGGLPFVIGNTTGYYSPPVLGAFNQISYTGTPQGFGEVGAQTIELVEASEAGVQSSIADTDFTDSSSFTVSFTYFV